jgi:Fur family transcriptional regulator, ferric uptake regulator
MNGVTKSLKETLKDGGYSLTNARQQVFNALTDSDTLSMNQLVRKLQHKMDRASVYRTIDLYEKLGIVNRLQIGWKYKLELSQDFADHHHHAACMQCGKVIAFEEAEDLQEQIEQIAKNLHFSVASHSLEIRGLCPTCQSTNETPADSSHKPTQTPTQ